MLYYIWTVGCQMNKADSERLAAALERVGLRAAPAWDKADVIVVNSCSVRGSAEQRVLGKLGMLKPLKRARPDVVIALAGCMVGDELGALRRQLPHVDVFLRPLEVEELLRKVVERRDRAGTPTRVTVAATRTAHEMLEVAEECPEVAPAGRDGDDADLATGPSHGPVRWVPIIYGCDNFCTYCIVPFRRGRERSRPIDEIAAEVRQMVADGAREVTLLGQNVDSYGHDLPGRPDLADLLAVIDGVQGLRRIRFLTSHPKDMSDRLIRTVARLPKVCEYINLPVQAGDDEILRRMGRRYTVDQYRRLVERIRATIPGVSLSTDLIVGFPGETDEQFRSSYSLLEDLRFDAVHVAMYSPRPGTAAARLADDVPGTEKKTRLQMVEALQERIAAENNLALLGTTVEVLVEGKNKDKWQGRTCTNRLVFFKSAENWLGRLAVVKVETTGPWSLQGDCVGLASVAQPLIT
ncbi:MAG: tRNA (N6-isopentenyl adenosine(37)-C2)-methylthiotransferase MiaB [Chloroflexi bacterium]|nr:tRNA (N6-isopentenyl adenosine(37)-C2)-methylthiotransferase MiaB [Chloroflexota bacterium]